jgi:hypothetical protein
VTAAVPHVLLNSTVFGNTEDGDPDWAADCLSDDDIDTDRPEAAVAPLLEEGELDADAIVVSPTGNSALAANNGAFVEYGADASGGVPSSTFSNFVLVLQLQNADDERRDGMTWVWIKLILWAMEWWRHRRDMTQLHNERRA